MICSLIGNIYIIYNSCFCCDVVEGYGLTENFAGALITALDETRLGHVGKPLSCMGKKTSFYINSYLPSPSSSPSPSATLMLLTLHLLLSHVCLQR